MKTKFQSFITENTDDDERMGIYVSVSGILNAIKFLKDRNIRFVSNILGLRYAVSSHITLSLPF